MTPTKEKILVMEAFDRGEEIEASGNRYDDKKWNTVQNPVWDWDTFTYRIKPKPKQTVTIEKWLVTNGKRFDVAETSDIDVFLGDGIGWKQAKLLDTYEVTL